MRSILNTSRNIPFEYSYFTYTEIYRHGSTCLLIAWLASNVTFWKPQYKVYVKETML